MDRFCYKLEHCIEGDVYFVYDRHKGLAEEICVCYDQGYASLIAASLNKCVDGKSFLLKKD